MLKKHYITLVLSLPFLLYGQSFEFKTSSDSILIGNYIELSFTAENVDGDFEAPTFENVEIVGGPNTSSSIQIINGDQTSSTTWSYYIKPNEMGEIVLDPAFLVTAEKTYETDPIILNVYPNPDGIIENPKQKMEFSIFDDFDFPFSNPQSNPQMNPPITPELDSAKKEKPKKPTKKLKRI